MQSEFSTDFVEFSTGSTEKVAIATIARKDKSLLLLLDEKGKEIIPTQSCQGVLK